MEQKILVSMGLSRTNRDEIYIYIKDEQSRTTFLEMDLSLEVFAKLVTGLHQSDIPVTVRGLEYVGKSKISENRKVIYPGSKYDSKEIIKEWLVTNCQEDGWILDDYLGSQGSIQLIDDQRWVNYRVYKYE